MPKGGAILKHCRGLLTGLLPCSGLGEEHLEPINILVQQGLAIQLHHLFDRPLFYLYSWRLLLR
jgi:hypothetical protein